MARGRIDSITGRPYVIGESFTDPDITKRAAESRKPYWTKSWAAKGPSDVKRELFKRGQLNRFPSVWRRAAKTRHIEKLGAVMSRRELPDFQELGQAPGPTDIKTTTSSSSRGIWGFLDSAIKSAGVVIGERQKLEMVKAQAQAQQAIVSPTMLPTFFIPGEEGGLGMLGWAAIIGTLGVGTYLFMRK